MRSAVDERIRRAHDEIVAHEGQSATDHQHPVFCQLALPYEHETLRAWERKIGKLSLRLDAGVIADEAGSFQDVPLPYGRYPRLILMHLNNEAIRREKPVVEIDRTLTDFTSGLGLDTAGRIVRDIRQQLCNLALSTLRVWHDGASMLNGQMVENTDFTMRSVGLRAATSTIPGAAPASHHEVRTMWPKQMTLNRAYFQSVREHAVVLDRRAINALMHSASALDAYSWLCYSLSGLARGDCRMSRWPDLHHQFGHGYRHESHFRTEFRKNLAMVQKVYPSAVFEPTDEGVVVRRSPPPDWQRRTVSPPRLAPRRRTLASPVAAPIHGADGQTLMQF